MVKSDDARNGDTVDDESIISMEIDADSQEDPNENKKQEKSSKNKSEKSSDQADGRPTNLSSKPTMVLQDRDVCGSGFFCKAPSMPLNTQHRCAGCGWCIHGDCGLELVQTRHQKQKKQHELLSTFQSTCKRCVDHFELAPAVKFDKNKVPYLHLKSKDLQKIVRVDWPQCELTSTISDEIMTEANLDHGRKSADDGKKEEKRAKRVIRTGIPRRRRRTQPRRMKMTCESSKN